MPRTHAPPTQVVGVLTLFFMPAPLLLQQGYLIINLNPEP